MLILIIKIYIFNYTGQQLIKLFLKGVVETEHDLELHVYKYFGNKIVLFNDL